MATYFDPYALSPHAPPPPSSDANFVGAGEFSGFGLTTQPPPPPPPRVHYNLWPSSIIDHHTPPPATTTSGGDMIFRQPSPLHQQGLSLSLNSSQQSVFSSAAGQPQAAIVGGRAPPGFILGSKYLKATQEVLDEVVNVGIEDVSIKEKVKEGNYYCDGSSGGSGENNNSEQLTTSQRQELQMKKSNLVAMLHEVEQRYKEYEEQMQIVIRSFEEAAGIDGARAYTWVALRTISKQFRSLKEAIRSQVKATSKRLGSEVEEYCLGAKVEGCKLQRYNHNINMVHMNMNMNMNMVNHNNNAWRPQRGLPERAVTILRAWLFDHFLHPYPKDSDKVMLAKQTGLTRSQVSNWFINARVRLWKPMVEEMYKEEMKDQLHDGSQSHDENSTIKSKGNKKEVVGSSSSNNNNNIIKEYSSSSSHNNNNSHIPQPPHKKLGLGTYSVMNMMMNNDGDDDEDGGLISMEHINGSRYNYNNNFYHGSNNGGVSLTLGLPHDEFCGINTTHIATPSHAASTTTRNINNNYENSNIINMHHIHNNTKRFAASQSLIPDFVSLS